MASVRIADDICAEIRAMQPENMSFNKTVEVILKLAVKKIKEENAGRGQEENFSVPVNKNDSVFSETADADPGGINTAGEERNREKNEADFEKVEKGIEEILCAVRKMLSLFPENKGNGQRDNGAYAGRYTPPPPQKFNEPAAEKVMPVLLPLKTDVWRAIYWKVDFENGCGVLINFGLNKLAKFDVEEKKIMVTTCEMLEVWHEYSGDMAQMMAECERRVAETFYMREPDWFNTGLQFMPPAERNRLYKKQDLINKYMVKEGKKYASWRY